MAEWKKVLVSGSNIEVNQITGSGDADIQGTLSIGGIADVSASIAANNEIQTSILSNQTVGGISSGELFNAGTEVEELLRQILISFIQSTIGTPLLRNNGGTVNADVREVNSSITADQFRIPSVTANDPNGLVPTNLSLTGSGATSGNFENDYSSTTLTAGTNTITFSPDEVLNINSISTANSADITITARAQDPTNNAILTESRNYKYVYPFYYGASATDLSSATGTALETANLTKLVEEKGTKELTMAATSQYLYFAYPSRYGNLADIKDANNSSQLANNYTKHTVTIDGGNGWSSVQYFVYQSNGTTSITSQTYTISF